jgi:hypothetical protein
MRFPALLIFVLLIPAFIALGHDIQLFYVNHAQDAHVITTDFIKEKFKFSAFGFIWTNYEPESYKATASSLDPETWAMVDKFLTIKAFFAGLTFAGVMVALLALLALFGIGPMAGEAKLVYGSNKKEPTRIGKKSGGMEYKRK